MVKVYSKVTLFMKHTVGVQQSNCFQTLFVCLLGLLFKFMLAFSLCLLALFDLVNSF